MINIISTSINLKIYIHIVVVVVAIFPALVHTYSFTQFKHQFLCIGVLLEVLMWSFPSVVILCQRNLNVLLTTEKRRCQVIPQCTEINKLMDKEIAVLTLGETYGINWLA